MNESAGLPHGNYPAITIDGWACSPDRRGVNVVIIDPRSRTVRRYAFDTHAGDGMVHRTID